MAKTRNVLIPYAPRAAFAGFHERSERWACIVAHRRAGKTVAAINELIRAALRCERPAPRLAYVAPYTSQAKDLAWGYLRQYTAPIPGVRASVSELRVDLPNGGRVRLYGADNYNRLRGIYLYRALELLRSAAANSVARDLAAEGGLTSALWAGVRRRSDPAGIRLSVGLADPAHESSGAAVYSYEVDIGWPAPMAAAFAGEAQIKAETVSYLGASRPIRLLERAGPAVTARGEDDRPVRIDLDILGSETALGRFQDPSRFPELEAVRTTLLEWRFYHGFRTDADSPLRRPCAAATTATLASDGGDLAAVFATLAHIRRDIAELNAVIEQAFPGGKLIVPSPGRTASFAMTFPAFPQRLFEAAELSDGTLRFLALAGALMAYRLPPFIALNEPETSLHPDLMAPLARLIVHASQRTQVWLVTHSTALADAVIAAGGAKARVVIKQEGATTIEGLKGWGAFEDED